MAADLLGFAAAGSSVVLGSLFVAESPRWLFLRGKKELCLRFAAAVAFTGTGRYRTA